MQKYITKDKFLSMLILLSVTEFALLTAKIFSIALYFMNINKIYYSIWISPPQTTGDCSPWAWPAFPRELSTGTCLFSHQRDLSYLLHPWNPNSTCMASLHQTRPTNLCMCSLHISSKWLIKLGIVSVAGKKKGEQPSRGQRSRFSEKTRMRKCVKNSINSLYLRPQHVTSRAGWSNCTWDKWNIGQSWNTSFSRKPFDIATKSFIFIPWLIVVRLVCHQGLQMKRIGRHNLHSKMMPG